ncbi:MAG: Nudix family hydrolase [Rhodocyclaceae bacterium]
MRRIRLARSATIAGKPHGALRATAPREMSTREFTEVAAAVILRADGGFLLGRRAAGTFYPGYWEFPGGKCEPGEPAACALARELEEELGIRVRHCEPWIVRTHAYPHANVRLHFFRVRAWSGEIAPRVHAALAWQRAGAVTVAPVLPANAPVLRALSLPDFYAITHAGEIGIPSQLAALDAAIAAGVRMVQLREPLLSGGARRAFAVALVEKCHAHGVRVLVNSGAPIGADSGADGLHLSSARLMACRERPAAPWVAASCHDERELAWAAALGLDFVVLGPVRRSASHPQRAGMGWERFGALIRGYPLPVYALGGMRAEDAGRARSLGAQGIAAIRAAWAPGGAAYSPLSTSPESGRASGSGMR